MLSPKILAVWPAKEWRATLLLSDMPEVPTIALSVQSVYGVGGRSGQTVSS